jgi:hypothetical protein
VSNEWNGNVKPRCWKGYVFEKSEFSRRRRTAVSKKRKRIDVSERKKRNYVSELNREV